MNNGKEKFTPGPWHILTPKPHYGKRTCHSIVDSNGGYVAYTGLRGISAVKQAERKANEYLIAAAPDMYDCICDALTDLEMTDGMRAHFEETLKKARGEE